MSLGFLGHGVGLRVPHYERALSEGLDVDWVELISENFFGGGGRPRAVLARLRRELPVVFHGVSMGIGSLDGPSTRYLAQLGELADVFEPAWLSDHLCWTSFEGQFSHDLLPLPYTEEALLHVVSQLGRVQDYLRRPLLLENVSSYVSYTHSTLPEWEFLSEVARRSGCLILLDVNNVIVSAQNHGFRAIDYLDALPVDKVQQLHLANHSDRGAYRFDDHRGAVPEVVWQLYEAALCRFGAVSSLIEWDEDVPSWELLRAEQRKASARARALLLEPAALAKPEPKPAAPVSMATRFDDPNHVSRPAASLREAQTTFWRAITAPEGVRRHLEQATPAIRSAFAEVFASSDGFDRMERVDVYANAYFYRLLGALEEMFPRVCGLLGATAFHNLVTDYVLACPSQNPDLRHLGDHLPGYLQGHALGRTHPVLTELAELERAVSFALDADPGNPLGERELLELPSSRWLTLRLRLCAPCSLLNVHWDLERVSELCRAGQHEAALGATRLPRPLAILVGRRGHRVYFRGLDALEGLALGAFQSGSNFEQVCADLGQVEAGFQPEQMVTWLRRWLADEAIEAIAPG